MSKPFAKPADAPTGEKKPAAAAPPKPKPPRKPSPWPWGLFRRIVVSVLLSWHLLAVFVAPWFLDLRGEGFALPPRDAQGRTIPRNLVRPEQLVGEPPVLAIWLYDAVRHYADLLYINNGYEFFSPDPIWSYLLKYEVFDAQGQVLAEGRIPDRRDQWPRLFYHRHMMLVEQAGDEAMRGADAHIAQRLLQKHRGEVIRVQVLRHHLLTPRDVAAGKRPDEPSTYEVIESREYRRRDATSEDLPPAAAATPGAAS
jgi:hypothetical protein